MLVFLDVLFCELEYCCLRGQTVKSNFELGPKVFLGMASPVIVLSTSTLITY